MIRALLLILFIGLSSWTSGQKGINWLSIEEAVEANKKEPKLIFVDVYTNWCGWCRKMDAGTFNHKQVSEYMNANYYCVKFNAETKDTIQFMGQQFTNPKPAGQRGTHKFARALLDNQMSYPKFVVMNQNFERISIIPGYHDAKGFEPIMRYFGDNAYLQIPWEKYNSTFKSSF